MADGSKSSDHVRKIKQKRNAKTEEEKQEDTFGQSPKSLKRKATDVDKNDVVSPSKRKAVSKEKNAKSTPSSTSKSPKKKITENEKLKSSKSQSRSKSPQKKATDKKVDTPVHKPKSPKGLKSPKKA